MELLYWPRKQNGNTPGTAQSCSQARWVRWYSDKLFRQSCANSRCLGGLRTVGTMLDLCIQSQSTLKEQVWAW